VIAGVLGPIAWALRVPDVSGGPASCPLSVVLRGGEVAVHHEGGDLAPEGRSGDVGAEALAGRSAWKPGMMVSTAGLRNAGDAAGEDRHRTGL
jgi:hypothetical protein